MALSVTADRYVGLFLDYCAQQAGLSQGVGHPHLENLYQRVAQPVASTGDVQVDDARVALEMRLSYFIETLSSTNPDAAFFQGIFPNMDAVRAALDSTTRQMLPQVAVPQVPESASLHPPARGAPDGAEERLVAPIPAHPPTQLVTPIPTHPLTQPVAIVKKENIHPLMFSTLNDTGQSITSPERIEFINEEFQTEMALVPKPTFGRKTEDGAVGIAGITIRTSEHAERIARTLDDALKDKRDAMWRAKVQEVTGQSGPEPNGRRLTEKELEQELSDMLLPREIERFKEWNKRDPDQRELFDLGWEAYKAVGVYEPVAVVVGAISWGDGSEDKKNNGLTFYGRGDAIGYVEFDNGRILQINLPHEHPGGDIEQYIGSSNELFLRSLSIEQIESEYTKTFGGGRVPGIANFGVASDGVVKRLEIPTIDKEPDEQHKERVKKLQAKEIEQLSTTAYATMAPGAETVHMAKEAWRRCEEKYEREAGSKTPSSSRIQSKYYDDIVHLKSRFPGNRQGIYIVVDEAGGHSKNGIVAEEMIGTAIDVVLAECEQQGILNNLQRINLGQQPQANNPLDILLCHTREKVGEKFHIYPEYGEPAAIIEVIKGLGVAEENISKNAQAYTPIIVIEPSAGIEIDTALNAHKEAQRQAAVRIASETAIEVLCEHDWSGQRDGALKFPVQDRKDEIRVAAAVNTLVPGAIGRDPSVVAASLTVPRDAAHHILQQIMPTLLTRELSIEAAVSGNVSIPFGNERDAARMSAVIRELVPAGIVANIASTIHVHEDTARQLQTAIARSRASIEH